MNTHTGTGGTGRGTCPVGPNILQVCLAMTAGEGREGAGEKGRKLVAGKDEEKRGMG